jgi:hypothetical protein
MNLAEKRNRLKVQQMKFLIALVTFPRTDHTINYITRSQHGEAARRRILNDIQYGGETIS